MSFENSLNFPKTWDAHGNLPTVPTECLTRCPETLGPDDIGYADSDDFTISAEGCLCIDRATQFSADEMYPHAPSQYAVAVMRVAVSDGQGLGETLLLVDMRRTRPGVIEQSESVTLPGEEEHKHTGQGFLPANGIIYTDIDGRPSFVGDQRLHPAASFLFTSINALLDELERAADQPDNAIELVVEAETAEGQ